MRKNFIGLDWLRFGMAIYIVAFHTLGQYPGAPTLPFRFLFSFGGFATSTFFMLSGFLLSEVYITAHPQPALKTSAHEFLVRRFANIYPVHLFSLALLALCGLVSTHSLLEVQSNTVMPGTSWLHTMSTGEAWLNLLLQALLLHAWNPLYLSFNTPTWSLSTLAFFYLLFPFIAPRLLRLERKMAALAFAFVLFLTPAIVSCQMAWYGNLPDGILHTNPLIRLPEFAAGILAYALLSSDSQLARTICLLRPYLFGMIAALFIAGAWLFAHGPIHLEYILHNGALFPAQVLLVMSCATVTVAPDHRGVMSKLARRLGASVLSTLCLHQPLFRLFGKAEKLLHAPFSSGYCVGHLHDCIANGHRIAIQLHYFPLYLCVTVCLSMLFQERCLAPMRKTIERVLLNRENRKTRVLVQAFDRIGTAPETIVALPVLDERV